MPIKEFDRHMMAYQIYIKIAQQFNDADQS